MVATTMPFGGPVPVTDLAHCVAAYQAVLHTLGRLDDASARDPSLLPDWTRAHVVTHLARHADSLVRVLDGLRRGEQIPQYTGGEQSRAAEIRRGERRKASTMVDDFQRANEELFSVWEAMGVDDWDRDVALIHGPAPAAATAWSRWFELSVHHVDLDLGFDVDQWSRAFATTALRRLLEGLQDRAEGEPPDDGASVAVVPADDSVTYRVRPDGAVHLAEPAPDDIRVEGSAGRIVWWLLGRADPSAAGLTVVGAGTDLPERFPYH